MYKAAIIGVSGGRAKGHAEAYQHIKRAGLVAVSSRQKDKLEPFAKHYNIAASYTDYREMFAREKLDLVHVNTPPDIRLEILRAADTANIPLVVLEKPLAIQTEDYLELLDFAKTSKVKVAINHQLHFQPRRALLQNLVYDGKLGDVSFIDASSGMNMAYQGTHTLQAITAFSPEAKPISIMGQASGGESLADTPKKHFAPDALLGSFMFDNGVSALLRCGSNAPKVINDERLNLHKRISVYGSQGHVHWSMWHWETLIKGKLESGKHDYFAEDILGQAALTEAMFDWLEFDKRHPLNLNAALQDFHILLKLYMSALNHKIYSLEDKLESQLIDALRTALT